MSVYGWQPIETAPDLEDGVLVVDANKPHPAVGVARYLAGRWRGYDHSLGVECYYPTPTHWHALPAAPSTAGVSEQHFFCVQYLDPA